jgi:hypothetical protein
MVNTMGHTGTFTGQVYSLEKDHEPTSAEDHGSAPPPMEMPRTSFARMNLASTESSVALAPTPLESAEKRAGREFNEPVQSASPATTHSRNAPPITGANATNNWADNLPVVEQNAARNKTQLERTLYARLPMAKRLEAIQTEFTTLSNLIRAGTEITPQYAGFMAGAMQFAASGLTEMIWALRDANIVKNTQIANLQLALKERDADRQYLTNQIESLVRAAAVSNGSAINQPIPSVSDAPQQATPDEFKSPNVAIGSAVNQTTPSGPGAPEQATKPTVKPSKTQQQADVQAGEVKQPQERGRSRTPRSRTALPTSESPPTLRSSSRLAGARPIDYSEAAQQLAGQGRKG